MMVEQPHHVREPKQPELPGDTVERKARPNLHRSGSRALPMLEHLFRITVLEEACAPLITAVSASDGHEATCRVLVGLIPGKADKLVVAAVIELVAHAPLGVVGERWESVVGPFLPAAPHDGVAEAIRPVDPAMEGVSFQATPGIPGPCRLVPVQVRVSLVVVVLL